MILYQIFKNHNSTESFSNIDYQQIKTTIMQNYQPIIYEDKNSLNQFKTYVSNILGNFEIERKKFFLKAFDLNKRYNLEVIVIIGDILKKLIEIELLIVNNKIEIQDINIKNNDQILLPGFEQNMDSNFLIPSDFSWKENPVFQNIVVPDETNPNLKLSGNNLKQLFNSYQVKNNLDIKKAINMAEAVLKNRKSFYKHGFCFGTKLIGIDNQKDCENNSGIWDHVCTKNEDCKFFKPIENGRGGRGGCIEPGYCEFPKGVERIGYTKERKRELDRINKLKLGEKYNLLSKIELDIPSCYCDDPKKTSPDCCYNKDYVF